MIAAARNTFPVAGSLADGRSVGDSQATEPKAHAEACDGETIEQTIRRLRTRDGWWNGDPTARQVLAAFAASILAKHSPGADVSAAPVRVPFGNDVKSAAPV